MIDPRALSRLQRLAIRLGGLGPALDFIESPDASDAEAFCRSMCVAYNIHAELVWPDEPAEPVRSTVFCCTHPTGASDFVGAYALLAAKVGPMRVPMHPSLCEVPPLASVGLPTWPPSHKVRNTATAERLVEHLRAGGNALVFPAGRVGSLVGGRVVDAPWRPGLGEVLAASGAGAVPVWIDARNSRAFYAVRERVRRLSLPVVFFELLRTRRTEVRVVVGQRLVGGGPGLLDEVRRACDALADQHGRGMP